MDVRRRYTKRYGFRIPDVGKLKELASLVENPSDFRKRYGTLLTVLNTNVDEGLLKNFVQFYDPVYRCFTFPDYQLMPTLEEYAHKVSQYQTRCLSMVWKPFLSHQSLQQ